MIDMYQIFGHISARSDFLGGVLMPVSLFIQGSFRMDNILKDLGKKQILIRDSTIYSDWIYIRNDEKFILYSLRKVIMGE